MDATDGVQMKRILKVVVFLVAVTAGSPMLMAQWPAFSMAGVPRTPDGKPNLEGPTPRTQDGKPDFSGVWGLRGPGGGGRGGAPAGQRGQNPPPNAPGAPVWPLFDAAQEMQSMKPPAPLSESGFATDHMCSFWLP